MRACLAHEKHSVNMPIHTMTAVVSCSRAMGNACSKPWPVAGKAEGMLFHSVLEDLNDNEQPFGAEYLQS